MHKVAFQIGDFTIAWYGVFMAVGFMAALWTASRRAVWAGVDPEKVLDFGPWVIIGTVIGARILYVGSYWDRFRDDPFPEVFMVHRGGLVFYGGLMGSALACVLFVRKNRMRLWQFSDVLAPSVALGHMFGRIGCLMNGCCYGKTCSLPWGIRFPQGHETEGTTVHPTQIYESLLNLCLYLGLAWLFRRRKFDGQVFASYLLGYAILRSIVESFRGDYPVHYLGGWATPAHLVSMAIFACGATLYWIQSSKPASTPPPKSGARPA